MMNGKQKLYFLLNRIDDARAIAPSGRPIVLHPANDLNNKFTQIELAQLLAKLQTDEKVLQVIKIPNEVLGDKHLDPYADLEDGGYYIQILPAFDNYFLKIQQEPEYQEFYGRKPVVRKEEKVVASLYKDLSLLHPEIFAGCQGLYEKEAYAQAVEMRFKIVKDKLRDLTSYEAGSEAFSKGGLHIKGAAAPNVDSDFNQGVKFLTMAIDMFRNEKTHTSKAKIDDIQKAYEYLTLSSLAMHMLDQAEIIEPSK